MLDRSPESVRDEALSRLEAYRRKEQLRRTQAQAAVRQAGLPRSIRRIAFAALIRDKKNISLKDMETSATSMAERAPRIRADILRRGIHKDYVKRITAMCFQAVSKGLECEPIIEQARQQIGVIEGYWLAQSAPEALARRLTKKVLHRRDAFSYSEWMLAHYMRGEVGRVSEFLRTLPDAVDMVGSADRVRTWRISTRALDGEARRQEVERFSGLLQPDERLEHHEVLGILEHCLLNPLASIDGSSLRNCAATPAWRLARLLAVAFLRGDPPRLMSRVRNRHLAI